MSAQRTPSQRPEPRETRHTRRRDLDHQEARRFNRTRKLPRDFPSVRRGGSSDEWVSVSRGVFDRCEQWLDRSGLATEIEARLRRHHAPPSRLTAKAVLMGMILAVYVKGTYERTAVCSILCGLNADLAVRVGLCDVRGRQAAFSYEMVQTQISRIEDALRDGWAVPGGERNLMWFSRTAIEHSIPDEDKALVANIALDSTVSQTWAKEQVSGEEKELQKKLKANPPPPTPPGEHPAIGTNGPHGRVRRTNCPDALPAYTADRIVAGFDVHMATAIRHMSWGGDPRHITIGDPVVPYILAVLVMPGLVDYAASGVGTLEMARSNAPHAQRVISDMGYSQHPSYLTGARGLGYALDFDYKSEKGRVGKPNQRVYEVRIGTADGGETVLMNNGTLMPLWTPPEDQKPPEDLKGKKLRQWLAKRYQRVGYVCIQHDADGSRRVQCPQCAGKIRTTAATRSNAQKAQPRPPKRRTRATPGPKPRPIPTIKIAESFTHCCGGVRTIRPETATDKLIQYQDIPHKTPAWKTWYGYRNPSEGTNARAKNRSLLKHGWCKALGLAATTVGAVLVGVALNLKAPKKHPLEQQPDPDSPRAQLSAAVDRSPTITHNDDEPDQPTTVSHSDEHAANSADAAPQPDAAAGSDSRSPP